MNWPIRQLRGVDVRMKRATPTLGSKVSEAVALLGARFARWRCNRDASRKRQSCGEVRDLHNQWVALA